MANLRQKLLKGEQLIGTIINVVDTLDIIKIFKGAGFDYVMVDNEHGSIEYSKIAQMILLGNEIDLGIIIRIPHAGRRDILRYCDMGADGLMLPNCHNASIAKEMITHAKYTPQGNRGISMMRGHNRYIKVNNPLEYMKEQNERTLMFVQIESREGVKNVDAIMAVDGVDVAFIGPNDLSLDLGVMGQLDSPIYKEALAKVVKSAEKHGKFSGILTMTPEAMKPYIDMGMRANLYSNEVSFLMASAAAVKEIRTFAK